MASAAAPALPTSVAELASPAFATQRFEIELEFVQCLANPRYLNCTRACGFLPPMPGICNTNLPSRQFWPSAGTSRTSASAIICGICGTGRRRRTQSISGNMHAPHSRRYWARLPLLLGRFPQCLYFLELLENEQFCKTLAHTEAATMVDDQLMLHWLFYYKNRLAPSAPMPPAPPSAAP